MRLEKKPKAAANGLTSPRSHNVGVVRMLRLEIGRARMAQIGQPPPWRLAVGVNLARATTTAARVEATPSVLHGESGEGDEVFPRRRISTRSDATRRMKQGRPPVRIKVSSITIC